MSSQKKLNALLFELQTAQSPLAQAKTLARAWRTLRELSPTDRRLLARHVGFDGAEEMLEGLATKRGGLAPAVLLQALAKARTADRATVGDLVARLKRPEARGQVLAESLDFASSLLEDPGAGNNAEGPPSDDVAEALDELQAVQAPPVETPEEALEALNALDAAPGDTSEATKEKTSGDDPTERVVEETTETEAEASDKPTVRVTLKPPPPPPPPPRPVPDAVDWSRWESAGESRSETAPSVTAPEPSSDSPELPLFDAFAVLGALGAQSSIGSQLRVLRRELTGFEGSSLHTLRQVVAAFPDGWARRRALAALLEAGIPSDPGGAIELVETLEQESNRRWCLGILARRGVLWGSNLERALELLSSPAARRRIESAAIR
jgi:hypothetical protein